MATLVIMAAGGSTRFGRPKQLEPVAPDGATIPDVTLRDAFACGCSSAVLVVRPEHLDHFKERITDPRVTVVVQSDARGTGHAALLGMGSGAAPWVVVNGDDLYGDQAMKLACAQALRGAPQEHALVAFQLGRTLSPNGPVNRAMCTLSPDGSLSALHEVRGLVRGSDGTIRDVDGCAYDDVHLVSMNMWVIGGAAQQPLRTAYEVHEGGASRLTEFMLPAAMCTHIMATGERVRVIPSQSRWMGLTFPKDADLVRRHLSSPP